MLEDAAYTVAGNIVISLLGGIAAALYGRWFLTQWKRRDLFPAIWVVGGVAVLSGLLSLQSLYYGVARVLAIYLPDVNLWDTHAATAGLRILFILGLVTVIGAYLVIFCGSRRQAAMWTAILSAAAFMLFLVLSAILK